jgi:NAD(P)-dependent dehydrogenase (short-subunit alcohol dehydrogenase family)
MDIRGGLAGRRAVVIGGGVAIGRAVTLALAEAAVDVAFCDIDAAGVESTTATARSMGRRVLGRVADAVDPEQLAAFYAAADQFFGSVQIVVNVVGGTLMQPFLERSPADCADDIQRNYGYVLQSFRHAVPMIRKGGQGGSIINFTTIEAHRGAGGFAVYAGAKAATTNFSKAMANELGPERIRVNVIAPDTTESPGNRNAIPQHFHDLNAGISADWWARALAMYIPLQVPPSAEDLANAVLYLASDLSRSVTGQVLHVDGGTAAALGMIRWPHDEGITLPVPFGNSMRKLFGGD